MKKAREKRNSNCMVCGTRLSDKTETGEIRWRPSRVTDEGIICEVCLEPKKKGPSGGNSRKKR